MHRLTKQVLGITAMMLLVACGGGGSGGGDDNGTTPGDDNGTTPTDNNGTTLALKKTGQTKSYDENGNEVTDDSIRDDGYYQKGVTPSYTRDDAKEIVTDNITGLQWQDNADVKNVTKPWVTQENYDICSQP